MGGYYLAIDIGASSGRHILAEVENGKMTLQEIYRFQNGMQEKNGSLCWDIPHLFSEIKNGMKKCGEIGKIPVSVSVDTWGVDFVLLDEKDQILGDTVGYRDSRTHGMEKKVGEVISQQDLYKRTGIHWQMYNTIYQLQAIKETHPEYLEQARSILMTPDYFHFLLSGEKKMEYTIASTSQLLNARTGDWDWELLTMLGFPKEIFRPVSMPGTVAGHLTPEVREEVGYDCKVVLPASHDTGSAVLAVPAKGEDVVYISSGTWSLMGVERKEPDCSLESMEADFTNEGGYDHRYRYLRNIMGLWMIQSVKKELTEDMSFGEICEMAAKETIASIVDCNDESFMAPKSMIAAVQDYCRNTGQQVPGTTGEIAAVIYNSLAKCYADTLAQLERMTGKHYDTVYVVGGGSKAGYLNELTARYTGRRVSAGPTEATAIGNLTVQMLSDGVFSDLDEARKCIRESFEIEIYD
nr:rhamnulokinase [uncultured Merdimonas sp.]